MKLSILPLALACTGLLASASPLRVIVVSSGVNTPDNNSGLVAHLEPPRLTATPQQLKPCGGARFRQKVAGLAESFKIAFGFAAHKEHTSEFKLSPFKPSPFIGMGTPDHKPHFKPLPVITPGTSGKAGDNLLHILPIGPPQLTRPDGHIIDEHVDNFEGPLPTAQAPPHPHRHGHWHGHRFHHHGQKASFLMRVHFALMSLGPWEGRAVAFVLGCGIGVLLRMFWVLALISYRVIKGSPTPAEHDDYSYTVLSLDATDAEELFVAPPTYTYPVDEKVAEPIAVAVPSIVVQEAEEEERK